MFSRAITTPFAENVGDRLFPNITSENSLSNTDGTMIANMRLLLHSRLKEGESAKLVAREFKAGEPAKTLELPTARNELFVYNIQGSQERGEATLKTITNVLGKSAELKQLTALSGTLQAQNVQGVVFTNETLHNTVCVVVKAGRSAWHLISALVPALFSWCFEETPLQSDSLDYSLLSAMIESEPNNYLSVLKKYEALFPIREIEIRNKIKPVMTGYLNRAIANHTSQIASYTRQIEQYQSSISSTIAAKVTEQYMLEGAIAAKENDANSTELEDFFIINKNLHLEAVSDDKITFYTTGYLENFDPEVFERYFANSSGVFFRNNDGYYHKDTNTFFTNERIKQLIGALFTDDAELKLRMVSRFTLRVPGTVTVARGWTTPDHIQGYFPNPHNHSFACLGDNEIYINEAAAKGDYVQAIVQCMSANSGLTLTDSPVMDTFMKCILKSDCEAVIELPSGSIVTPQSACIWLDKKAAEEAEEVEVITV